MITLTLGSGDKTSINPASITMVCSSPKGTYVHTKAGWRTMVTEFHDEVVSHCPRLVSFTFPGHGSISVDPAEVEVVHPQHPDAGCGCLILLKSGWETTVDQSFDEIMAKVGRAA